ncbi:endonuclease/exonuclease/phosphatase family protein [Micromonospora pattaloongensis]|uniref:endonuclease/exonuclease/phosphatase family protein n=1 Tax=Micromonospora pattaloongensis TaxID=405436 RepID=UPI001FE135B6|nr:endonuclease/exonuclease/phosphatase family protein [Micromonospora pattaloongensis]
MGTENISTGAQALPSRSRGGGIVIAATLLTALLAGHRFIPNVRGVGSLIDSGAPFLGLGVPVLALTALLRRSRRALLAVLVPAVAWAALFGAVWLPDGGGPVELRVASQNLKVGNADPSATVRAVVASDPDVIALQEIAGEARPSVRETLRDRYPHEAEQSTVGLWSRWPIRESVGVDTGLPWTRALRAVVAAPTGDVVVYVVHLGSARAGRTATRDHTVEALSAALRRDGAQRIIVLGDFNTATTDRMMAPLTDQLHDAQAEAGRGFGFTWPSALPVTRPDHVLYRGLTAASAGVVRTPASDHRAVVAGFRR